MDIQLQKPLKIMLENTNLIHLLSSNAPNVGSVRETFFANQVGFKHNINYARKGDFLVDATYTFEIGGSNKKNTQIKDITNSFIVADTIEYGSFNQIPLWLFGFLY